MGRALGAREAIRTQHQRSPWLHVRTWSHRRHHRPPPAPHAAPAPPLAVGQQMPDPSVAGTYSDVQVVPGALMHQGDRAYAPDGSLCPSTYSCLSRRGRELTYACRHSPLAHASASAEGFLPVDAVCHLTGMDLTTLRMVARFSHANGTPRFQRVLVPTDGGQSEFIRATSGHSFDIPDDLISLLQNAVRDAKRQNIGVAQVSFKAVPDIAPFDPDAFVSTSSSSAPRNIDEPPKEQGQATAPPSPPPLEHKPASPKIEIPGVIKVSLSDDALP